MTSLHRKSPKANIYIDGRLENSDTRLLSVTRSVNGSRQDTASFELIDVGKQTKPRWQDQDIFVNNVQIAIEIEAANGAKKVVHWGKAVIAEVSESSDGDRVVIHSRLDDHLFGDNQYSIHYASRDRTRGSSVASRRWSYEEVHGKIIFNPVVDNVPQPNMFARPVRGGANQFFGWIHPDSINRRALSEFLGNQALNDVPTAHPIGFSYWSLLFAVHAMCQMLNPPGVGQKIKNPTFREMQNILPNNPHLVRNLALDEGDFLPQVLDKLLAPFGFTWWVEHESTTERKIKIQKRGEGPIEWLRRQRVGEDVRWEESAASTFDLTYDVTDKACNFVRVLGDYAEAEATFELMPAWDAQYDNAPEDELTLDHSAWRTKDGLNRAWRDWVLNENGDYTVDINPGRLQDRRFTEAYDLEALFPQLGNMVNNLRRRKFFPMISVAEDGTPAGAISGCLVQYYNPTIAATSEEGRWCPIYSGEEGQSGLSEHPDVELLDNECGIRFNGEKPPIQLMQYANKSQPTDVRRVRIRITATVRMDIRVIAEEMSQDTLIRDTKPLTVVSEKERYQYRFISRQSVVGQGFNFDRAIDDRENIKDQAEFFLSSWNHSTMDGTITVNGVDWEDLPLGTTVLGLENRDVSFKLTADRVDPDKYPTVTAITYDFQQQHTTLELDTWRQTQ